MWRMTLLPEVELPHGQLAAARGQVALSIDECHSKLYELEHVDVAPATAMRTEKVPAAACTSKAGQKRLDDKKGSVSSHLKVW